MEIDLFFRYPNVMDGFMRTKTKRTLKTDFLEGIRKGPIRAMPVVNPPLPSDPNASMHWLGTISECQPLALELEPGDHRSK